MLIHVNISSIIAFGYNYFIFIENTIVYIINREISGVGNITFISREERDISPW